MTQTFGTNENNDIYLGRDGNIEVLSGLEAVIGACETASKAQLGEMVLSDKLGIPNFQAVWVGAPNFQVFQAYLRNTLLNVLGVTGVQAIEIAPSGNVLEYTAYIETEFGSGVVSND